MAIKVNLVKCPSCGAELPIESGRDKIFCSYCGTRVIITNENEHIYRNIDEAKVKEAETNNAVQLKKMEMLERAQESAEKTKKIKMIVSIVLGAISLLFLVLGYAFDMYGFAFPGLFGMIVVAYIWLLGKNKDKADEEVDIGDKVRVPSAVLNFENKNYAAIEAAFENAGFTNIKCVALCDLMTGLLKKPGMVDSITINGKEITSGGKKFSPEAKVIISYHSLANR